MKRQRAQEDYRDEFEDYSLDSSLNELGCDEFSLNSLSFDDEREFVIEDGGKKRIYVRFRRS